MKLRTGLLMLGVAMGCTTSHAQNISEIAQSDPLIITGAIGTQNTFYYSSQGGESSSRLNNAIYANLNFQIYGINMPFSFTYNNSGSSFSYPHFTFSISPTYKGWTAYLGKHSMSMSNYVYNLTATGVGLEYHENNMRFGAFYGQLRKAINDDPTDPLARSPQYGRYGWGVKAGYGSNRNYIDLFVFSARDRMGTLSEAWYTKVSPAHNLVLGVKGHTGYKRFSLSANFATTFFTEDLNAQPLDSAVIGRWDKIFDARLSSRYRFAGDVSASWGWKVWNITAQYKLVQPDYKTLGTNYMTNNIQSYGGSLSGSLFRGRVSVGGNFSGQNDNVTKRQRYTTNGYVYSANMGWMIAPSLTFNGSYNGYRQRQSDGTVKVTDSIRVDRQMHSATGALNYSFSTRLSTHSFGVSHNFSRNLDRNPYATGESDVTTQASGANYTLGVKPIGMNFNFGYNHQLSKGYNNEFSTDMFTFGTSRSFLESKTLVFSLNANASRNKTQEQRTMSYGVSLSGNYTLKDAHVFSLIGSYNHYNNLYLTELTKMDGESYSISLNYNYSFTLLHLKKRAERQAAKQGKNQL